MPQSMGVGGGFFMVFYDKKTRKSYGINARETAPMAATEDMFKDNPEKSIRGRFSFNLQFSHSSSVGLKIVSL